MDWNRLRATLNEKHLTRIDVNHAKHITTTERKNVSQKLVETNG